MPLGTSEIQTKQHSKVTVYDKMAAILYLMSLLQLKQHAEYYQVILPYFMLNGDPVKQFSFMCHPYDIVLFKSYYVS